MRHLYLPALFRYGPQRPKTNFSIGDEHYFARGLVFPRGIRYAISVLSKLLGFAARFEGIEKTAHRSACERIHGSVQQQRRANETGAGR